MKCYRLVIIIALIGLSVIRARADTLNLRIIDQSGSPIAGVSIKYSYTATPPASPDSGSTTTDLNGEAKIIHPGMGGSSCFLMSAITYEISFPGVTFSKSSGTLPCGPVTHSETVTATDFPTMANVSSASYRTEFAGEMIVAVFGVNLADKTEMAISLPLISNLGGRQILVRDTTGADRPADLIYVSPTQINYILPAGLIDGTCMVRLLSDEEMPVSIANGTVELTGVAPGLYSADATGQNLAAAVIMRVHTDGTFDYDAVAVYDQANKKFIPVLIDFGPPEDDVYLVLFGTGWRFRSSLSAVTCTIGGMGSEVTYADKQGEFSGLDQANVRLSRTLAGRGGVDILLTVDGKEANQLQIVFK